MKSTTAIRVYLVCVMIQFWGATLQAMFGNTAVAVIMLLTGTLSLTYAIVRTR